MTIKGFMNKYIFLYYICPTLSTCTNQTLTRFVCTAPIDNRQWRAAPQRHAGLRQKPITFLYILNTVSFFYRSMDKRRSGIYIS